MVGEFRLYILGVRTMWQSIETAPRDGTRIDVWIAATSERVTDVFWGHSADDYNRAQMSWVFTHIYGDYTGMDFGVGGVVTHWMLRPGPP